MVNKMKLLATAAVASLALCSNLAFADWHQGSQTYTQNYGGCPDGYYVEQAENGDLQVWYIWAMYDGEMFDVNGYVAANGQYWVSSGRNLSGKTFACSGGNVNVY